MTAIVYWDWKDIGIMFRFYKTSDFSDYKVGYDIQILWFNLWGGFLKRSKIKESGTDITK